MHPGCAEIIGILQFLTVMGGHGIIAGLVGEFCLGNLFGLRGIVAGRRGGARFFGDGILSADEGRLAQRDPQPLALAGGIALQTLVAAQNFAVDIHEIAGNRFACTV